MLAESREYDWPPRWAPPAVPNCWNNFLIRRDQDACEDEKWTVYPINRVAPYLRWLEGERKLRMVRLNFVPVVPSMWPLRPI